MGSIQEISRLDPLQTKFDCCPDGNKEVRGGGHHVGIKSGVLEINMIKQTPCPLSFSIPYHQMA